MFARSEPMPLALRGVDVPAIIMMGVAANALVVSVMNYVATGGGMSLTFGISPFQLVAIVVAVKLFAGSGGQARATPLWLDMAVLALVLVPSSAVSWGALALYAAAHAYLAQSERRTGALIFLAVALASIWSSVILKWLALPVTSAEAFVLGQILHLIRPDVIQFANVVGNPDTHSLILMTRCTTADGLPHAAIAMVAVAYLLGAPQKSKLRTAFVVLALVYAAANLIRLAGMAWSADAYALVHGPVGANVFDLFQALLVLGLGNWVSEP